jgi:hypothetical protein
MCINKIEAVYISDNRSVLCNSFGDVLMGELLGKLVHEHLLVELYSGRPAFEFPSLSVMLL